MNKLIVIGGPTGAGKSELAVKLAIKYNAMIIGADSAQIYRGMDIGTGKISEDEKCGIPHTMIDIVTPDVEYSVENYCRDAKKIISDAHAKSQLPIVVGGTGLYLNAILTEQNFANSPPNRELREKYYKIYDENGAAYLHGLLKEVDSVAAGKIAVNDIKRIVRALEIYEQTGSCKSEIVSQTSSGYDFKFLVPCIERDVLYDKINRRVDGMFRNGLVDEVNSLKRYWKCRSMQAIGYKEIISAIENNQPVENAVEIIKMNSRRYAKRQMTFLKWIKAEKQYLNENFYDSAVAVCDKWINEE